MVVSPVVLMKIWNTYVVPRFLYGLEVQNPTKKDIKKLEQLQRKVCRQFPERTSSIAVYALTGAEPIAVTLNKYCINLFFGIVRLDSTIEKQMLLWESANANANDTLFINIIAGVAQFLVFREVFCRSWFVLFLLAIVLSIEYGRSWVRAPIVANQRL